MRPVPTAPQNFRDLGGIHVDGGIIRSGILFRSDDLSIAPAEFIQTIASDLPVTSIIDLRLPAEATATGRGELAHLNIRYHHLPFGDALHISNSETVADMAELSEWYAHLAETGANTLVTAIALMGVEPGVIIFHCAIGKDRTGVLAAAILAVLGADDDTIATEYALSSASLDDTLRRFVHARGKPGGAQRLELTLASQARRPIMLAKREAMLGALTLITHRHGSFTQLLQNNGLNDGHVIALRQHMVNADDNVQNDYGTAEGFGYSLTCPMD